MKKIHNLLKINMIFFGGLLISLTLCVFLLTIFGKEVAFLTLNNYHSFYLNVFFINYTFVGDGIFALCLVGMMFFYYKRKQQAFALLYSFLISGIAAQLIKNLVNSPRPKLYFEAGQYLHFIDGVSLANNSSFPSGHTATAFAIATVMAMMIQNKNWQLLILPAALLVGYSRIYLAQHFLVDVLVGMIIGCASGAAAVYFAKNRISLKRSFKKIHQLSPDTTSPTSAIQTS